MYTSALNNLITDEVAIIDEIQMIGDRGRGWAWTRAVLGVLYIFLIYYLYPVFA